MKKYEVSKNGKVYAVVDEPYPVDIVRGMKKAGYKVKEIEVKTTTGKEKNNDWRTVSSLSY